MALIKLTASELENVQSQIEKMSSKASNCATTVSSVRNNLDMEVATKRNIEDRLDSIKRDIAKHSDLLRSYANVLNDVINDFVRTDSLGATSRNASLSSLMNGALVGGVLVGSLNGEGRTVGHTGYNLKTQQELGKLSMAGSMFGGASSVKMTSIGDNLYGNSVEVPAKKIFEGVKTGKNAASLIETIVSICNDGDVPDFIKKHTDLKIFKGVGYITDMEKAVTAVADSDMEALTELLGKYGIKKPLKEIVEVTVGGASAEVGLLTDLIYSDFESAIDVSENIVTELSNVITNQDSNIIDYAKVISNIYRAPDKIITEGFMSVVGDYADKIGGVLKTVGIVDIPEDGYINFYKDAFSDIKNMYNTLGAENTTSILIDSFKETASVQFKNTVDTLSEVGKGISQFFNGVF